MMWVFMALATVELLVVHFLLALWSPLAAFIVSALTLPTLIWLVVTIASFRRLPVLIGDDRVLMRTGQLKSVSIPLGSIARLRSDWTGDELKQPGVKNLALIAYPNVWIELHMPVQGRRGPIRAVAHKLDDPTVFRAALERRLSSSQ